MSSSTLRLAAIRKIIAESRANNETLLKIGEKALQNALTELDKHKPPQTQPASSSSTQKTDIQTIVHEQIAKRDLKAKKAIKTTVSTKDRTQIKRSLFTTYEECSKTKRSDPKFMSRDNLVKHIRAERHDIVARTPQFYKMTKDELCKEIMKT